MRMRSVLGLVLAFGVTSCIVQARNVIDPPASGGGSLTCRQIVEQCDVNCSDPLCVRACGNQGTPDAAALHNAVVDCAQRNSCMDMACIETNCAAEAGACRGPDAGTEVAPAPTEAPPTEAPTEAPPTEAPTTGGGSTEGAP